MAGDCGSSCPVEGGFYSHPPNLGGNAFFVAAFGLLVLLVVFRGLRYQTVTFATALLVGVLLEVLGFVGRLLLHQARDDRRYFTLSLLGTLLGPVFMSGAIFLVVPHLMRIYGDRFGPLRPSITGFVFLVLIFGAGIVQLVGIVSVAYGFKGLQPGKSAGIIAAGLGLQVLTLLVFAVFHVWLAFRVSSRRSLDPKHSRIYQSPKFIRFLRAMELATIILVACSVYRTVEVSSGLDEKPFQSEVAFLIMNGALPFVACVLISILHPGAAFGHAWESTSPRRARGRAPAPAPLQQPLSYRTHHRYDPSIGKQTTPTSQRLRYSDPPKVASGSPGLPPNPKPLSKPPSPRAPPPIAQTPPFDQRFYDAQDVIAQDPRVQDPRAQGPRKNMVDSDALW